MFRGGRGGGRGGFAGRGGAGGANMPAMGLTFTDLQQLSREPTALYPDVDPLPVLSAITDREREQCRLQDELVMRLRKSAYYVVEQAKSDNLPNYANAHHQDTSGPSRPALQKTDLNQAFFPPDIWDFYFNPKKKPRKDKKSTKRSKIDLDMLEKEEVEEVGGENKKDPEKSSSAGSGSENDDQGDYEDVEDDDYNEDYFSTGSREDPDDTGGGDDGGGGGGGDFD